MAHEPKIDEISGTETTGHEWDGIEELNTPMPRWWLWMFYACIIWAIIYAILMPSLPFFKGTLGYSDRAAVATAVDELEAARVDTFARLSDASLLEIQNDAELFRFAMAAGKSAFGDNCATCHGSGAQGFKGYPNLNDDVWLWGGTFDDIRQTLTVGIRATHDDTRYNIMEAYGKNEFLTKDQVSDVTDYVMFVSGQQGNNQAAQRGAMIFRNQCASCHGDTAQGDQSQGAPNLTDQEWLFGGDRDTVYESIYYGRQGVMPNWNERLSPEMITALAVYVHALGGGEYADGQ